MDACSIMDVPPPEQSKGAAIPQVAPGLSAREHMLVAGLRWLDMVTRKVKQA